MEFRNSRWTMVMVGVIAFLVVGTMVWASPPAGAPSAPLQAYDAKNAHKVDGLHASKRPNPLTLLALNRNTKFPASVIPGAITRDKEVMTIVKSKDGAGSGLDADLLDGQDGVYYQDWGNLSNVPACFADGVDDDTVGGLPCTDGQVAKWNETTGEWECGSDETGAAGDHDHDAAYINDGAGEINASNDFNFTTSTHITNLDADLLDGQHASAFVTTASDYGRSGVASNLYEGTLTLTSKYLNEGQSNSVTSGMIVDGTVAASDLEDGATLAEILDDDGSGSGLDADLLDGQDGLYYRDWDSLTSVPACFADGVDDDTLDGLSCLNGQVAKWDGSAWTCADADSGGEITSITESGSTPLTFTGCDTGDCSIGMVTDGSGDCAAGYACTGGHTHDARYYTESEADSLFASATHNHDARYYTETELEGSGTASVHWNNLVNVPSGLDDGDDDTLGGLSCLNGQVAKWDDTTSQWECGDDETGGGGDFWSLTGNSGTTPGTNFLGTTDDKALELKVNNARALRLEPNATSPNLIGGHSGNNVTAGAYGATIGGGGASTFTNRVTDDYGTVGGGYNNQAGDAAGTTADRPYATVGGGSNNTASGYYATVGGGLQNRAYNHYTTVGGGEGNTAWRVYATVGGGYYNTAGHDYATVGGGWSNTASSLWATVGGGRKNSASNTAATVGGGQSNSASGPAATVGGGSSNSAGSDYATVGGGSSNIASGVYATVAGGQINTASGSYATVPGGSRNTAQGNYSFAAGRWAKANNQGCFVWGDSTKADVICSNNDRWIARASGGVYFYTSSDLSTGAYLAANSGTWSSVSDRNVKEDVEAVDIQDVLERLAEVPVSTWSYIGEEEGIHHIGPMAQDFYAAFGLGDSERHIPTIDADGVALAAIQGLYQLLQEKDAQIDDLEARVAALEAAAGGTAPGYPWQSGLLPGAGIVLAGVGLGWLARRGKGGGHNPKRKGVSDS